MVAHVHDEFQCQVRKELVEEFKAIAIWSFQEAGRQFNWKCLVDAESKSGLTWAETH